MGCSQKNLLWCFLADNSHFCACLLNFSSERRKTLSLLNFSCFHFRLSLHFQACVEFWCLCPQYLQPWFIFPVPNTIPCSLAVHQTEQCWAEPGPEQHYKRAVTTLWEQVSNHCTPFFSQPHQNCIFLVCSWEYHEEVPEVSLGLRLYHELYPPFFPH